ncbi:MAG: outer membrane lipoprotein carrier protein LolA [Bryobacterales bacterium]|nr:outer membrane lipoprotein carrier protein LolA [Bryobacterales bacterium]
MRNCVLTLLAFAMMSMPVAYAATQAEILARMDAAATSFKSLRADITRVKYTAILDDRSEESGTMTILRSGKDMRARIEITKPSERAVAFHGDEVEVYYPKIKTVQIFDLGKNRGLIDQFLLLGFGGSGKDIAKAYTVKVSGEEKIDGVNTTRIALTPKTAKVRELLQSVEMWIPDGQAYPIRQKFLEPSGDYMEVTYRNSKLNPNVTPADLKLDLPSGVKREYPQK